ncbi:MAG TPA: aminomethyl-transferring glycine dehydrogenase [bacterium]|nr:aminomethyl-transferring glycine dehydrogenase [bacterium]HPR89353.1 aminomethyl-transferring glycine dehydrogenase [bacterium]
MNTALPLTDTFSSRHIGPDPGELEAMLQVIGVASLDALIDQTIPANIRLKAPFDTQAPVSEYDLLQKLAQTAAKNRLFRSCIGLGFYDTITPPVIQRNIFENPGWYTQYTPYQAEISQGRLEALLIFQNMISDLTAMPIANASLLDEPTAAAEAMTMLFRVNSKKTRDPHNNVFLVADTCLPQTIDVLRTRSAPQGIELRIADLHTATPDERVFGILLQYPDVDGRIENCSSLIDKAHAAGALVAVATDLLALALLTPPGEMGADIVLGSAQRFGVPMGFGGPHAAFFATRTEYIRQMPGRIIGVSVDRHGHRAFRMTLQTREQHIRREKATSNICTAQALLAIMAGMYGVWHGPKGIKAIAGRVHLLSRALAGALTTLGCAPENPAFFDTLLVDGGSAADKIHALSREHGINFRHAGGRRIGIALDETTRSEDVEEIVALFAAARGLQPPAIDWQKEAAAPAAFPAGLARTSAFLTHPVFSGYHSEHKMVRFLKRLENKDLSLTTSMIPLGSCTMKLNGTAEMLPLTWPGFSKLHPFVPEEQALGYREIISELERDLCRITGFAAASFEPNSGAQGEFTGLMVIRAFHQDHGQGHRDVTLIPSSAHGTNPASAVMAGTKVVVVACDEHGNIDLADLRAKAEQYRETLSALMVTYPSTHGVFEEKIVEICEIIHAHGGLVYMDGANMNAQVGLTNPAAIGADVCHLNLHKTFAIPHGGGGPGMGPICVNASLAPYLPGHPLAKIGGSKAIPAVSATPYGSASILLISWAYIRLMGSAGLTEATQYAILNANYIAARLASEYKVLYAGERGRVAHEMIFDLAEFKACGIEAGDIAKRLMDYNFHAPTVAFPVHNSIMVEPTESEDKAELDRFCDALRAIRREIQAVADGKADPADNVLKNAPHTAAEVGGDSWNHPYTREAAAWPVAWLCAHKFWPAVGRIDDTYGDRNLFCICPPPEAYM